MAGTTSTPATASTTSTRMISISVNPADRTAMHLPEGLRTPEARAGSAGACAGSAGE